MNTKKNTYHTQRKRNEKIHRLQRLADDTMYDMLNTLKAEELSLTPEEYEYVLSRIALRLAQRMSTHEENNLYKE